MVSLTLECPGREGGEVAAWEQPSRRPAFSERALAGMTDEEVMTHLIAGQRSAFEEMVRRFSPAMFAYLRHYLGNAEMAEDALQQTFLQLHLKCYAFNPTKKVRPWLYTIATNQAIDLQRKHRRHRMISLNKHVHRADGQECDVDHADLIADDANAIPEDVAVGNERTVVVRHALDQLSEPQRQVVTLVYYQGMKYREAAEALGVPVGTVKSRVHSAIRNLGVTLEGLQAAV